MYNKTIGEHSFDIVLGQSAKQTSGSYLSGSRNNHQSAIRPPLHRRLHRPGRQRRPEPASGAPFVKSKLASYFGRASYNFDERYMVQATVRRDGSSRFGANNHWAIVPSVSVGWNIMNEAFLEAQRPWLNNFKLRASWGKNGNENIGNFQLHSPRCVGQQLHLRQRRPDSERRQAHTARQPRPPLGGIQADRRRPRPRLPQQQIHLLARLLPSKTPKACL